MISGFSIVALARLEPPFDLSDGSAPTTTTRPRSAKGAIVGHNPHTEADEVS